MILNTLNLLKEKNNHNMTPETKRLLEVIKARNLPPIQSVPLRDAREEYEELIKKLGGHKIDIENVIDIEIPADSHEVKLRLYSNGNNEVCSVIVFFHGGGWVKGSLDTHDRVCRQLAKHSHSIVVSVDYSLSPENRFPKALQEGIHVLKWVIKNIASYNGNPDLICLSGDSAGGNLAAVLTQHAAEDSIEAIKLQFLIYPVLDCSFSTQSYKDFSDGYLLTKNAMEFYFDSYKTPDLNGEDPQVSPLFNKIHEKLAPAILVSAELDPLKDEGFNYAEKLRNQQRLVSYECIEGVTHAFIQLPGVFPEADQALVSSALKIKDFFSRCVPPS